MKAEEEGATRERGRPPAAPGQKREFRENLLLNQAEHEVWTRMVKDSKARSGAELLRSFVEPVIRMYARRYGISIDKPET